MLKRYRNWNERYCRASNEDSYDREFEHESIGRRRQIPVLLWEALSGGYSKSSPVRMKCANKTKLGSVTTIDKRTMTLREDTNDWYCPRCNYTLSIEEAQKDLQQKISRSRSQYH
jgi:hypothetical protein